MLTDRANLMSDAWDDQLISDEEVRSWAETELLAFADARSIPAWLLDLAVFGSKPIVDVHHEWRRPTGFKIRFALRAIRLDLRDREAVESFVRWVCGSSRGCDHAEPEVQFGYEVDDCFGEMGDVERAVALVRERLPSLLVRSRAAIDAIMKQ